MAPGTEGPRRPIGGCPGVGLGRTALDRTSPSAYVNAYCSAPSRATERWKNGSPCHVLTPLHTTTARVPALAAAAGETNRRRSNGAGSPSKAKHGR